MIQLLYLAVIAAYGWVALSGDSGVFGSVAGSAALFLLPGNGVMALLGFAPRPARVFLLGPALSPLLIGLTVWTALGFDLDPRATVHAVILASGALALFLSRRREDSGGDTDEDTTGTGAWIVGIVLAAAVAVILVSSPWRRETLDAWFHTAVVFEIERAGIPPQDPYFASLPLQYFWFFHLVLVGFGYATHFAPPEAMAALNIAAAVLCAPAAARVVSALGYSARAGTWAGLLFLLGQGGLFWIFFPIKIIRLFVGSSTGADELANITRLEPFNVQTVATFIQVLASQGFLLRKFLVGTALSWALLLILLSIDAAVRYLRGESQRSAAYLFLAGTGAILFHVVNGGITLAALMAGGAVAFFGGHRSRGFVAALLAVLSIAVCIPYLKLVAGAKESSNMFPVGLHLWHLCSLPITAGGVLVLSIPAVRRFLRERDGGTLLFMGFLAASVLYGIFGRLPGPNQFDKPTIVLHVPLAIAAGIGLPMIWRSMRKRWRPWFVVAMVLYLVPENVVAWTSFFVDRHGPKMTSGESRFYDWVDSAVPPDAVFIDSDDRPDILVRGPRRLYWGGSGYAYQWGYSHEEMDRRRGLRDAVYAGERVSDEHLRALRAMDAPIYVIARESDHPGAGAALARDPRFQSVFQSPDIRAFRIRIP